MMMTWQDWRYYDAAYTERYMTTPALNPDGYNSTAVLSHLGNLMAPLLMVHGSADDNVINITYVIIHRSTQ